ncbi:hypothetical protein Ddc_10144 [Ditylenchus destructor]|nr:hypothetical protein Ddc_10144 [Ditylenchus destructor]
MPTRHIIDGRARFKEHQNYWCQLLLGDVNVFSHAQFTFIVNIYQVHIRAEIQFVDIGSNDAKTLGLYATETGGKPISESFCDIDSDFEKEGAHVKRKSTDVRHAKCEIVDDIKLTPKSGEDLVIYLGVTDAGVKVPDGEQKHGFRIPITKLRSRKRITQIQPKQGLTIHKTGKIELHQAKKKEINFWHKHLKHLFGSKDPVVDFAARFEF